MSRFFDSNSYFIDEKVNFLKFANGYKVYNDQGELVGSIQQQLSLGQKLLRLVLKKAMLPFTLEIKDTNEELQATVSRGWTFFLSKITVRDEQGEVVGIVKQKFSFLKPHFKIYNALGDLIAEISGDWKAWNFVIKNELTTPIGNITKKWAGVAKELFTSADKYNVHIDAEFSNKEYKRAVLAAAITIDMVLKESK